MENAQQSLAISYKTDRLRLLRFSNNDLIQAVRSGGGDIVLGLGRPDIRKLIEEELAASNGLRLSVDGERTSLLRCERFLLIIQSFSSPLIVSGPGPLAGLVKNILATSSLASPAAALRGGPSVTLHTEAFGW